MSEKPDYTQATVPYILGAYKKGDLEWFDDLIEHVPIKRSNSVAFQAIFMGRAGRGVWERIGLVFLRALGEGTKLPPDLARHVLSFHPIGHKLGEGPSGWSLSFYSE